VPPTIDRFDGKYRFLSNFYPSPIVYEGQRYRSVEHGYQAAKSLDPAIRQKIAAQTTPGKAKSHGRHVALRPDWESVKISVMRDLLRLKFAIPELHDQLLATSDAKLIEGNDWGDAMWGVYKGRGQNWLGRLLMKVRDELRGAR